MNILRKINCIAFIFSQSLVQDRISGLDALAGYGNTRHFLTISITFRWGMLKDSKWSKTLQFSICSHCDGSSISPLSKREQHASKLDAGCLTHGALTLGGPHNLCEMLLYVFMSVFDVFDIDGKRATFIEHRYIWAFFSRWFLLSGYLLTSVPSGQPPSKLGQTVTNARSRLEGGIISKV